MLHEVEILTENTASGSTDGFSQPQKVFTTHIPSEEYMTTEVFQHYYFALFQFTVHLTLLTVYQLLSTVAISGLLG